MTEKLILVLAEHRHFGWKINLYAAQLQQGGGFSILGVPNLREEIQKGASDAEVALIKAAGEVSDNSLMKAYFKGKEKDKIPQSTIDHLIRPRIESNCAKLLDLAQQTDIPVYFREKLTNKVLYENDRIESLPVSSHCLFNFVKDEKGLRYFISLTNGSDEIVLQQKPAIALSQEPCIILLGNQIHRVENIESKKLIPFFSKTQIEVPATSEKRYIRDFILKTIPKYNVKIEGIGMREKFPEKQAILILEEDFYGQLVFFLFFQYNNQRFSPAQKRKIITNLEEINGIENIYWFERDWSWESSLILTLTDLGLKIEADNRFYPKQNPEMPLRYGLVEWMNTNAEKLSDFVIEQKTAHVFYSGNIKIESRLDTKIDWFDLEITVVFDNFKLPFHRFRKHILSRNPEYVLPDGRIFIIPEDWFHHYQEFFRHGKDTERGIRLKKIHVGVLDNFADTIFSKNTQKELEQLTQITKKTAIPSENLNRILRPYQKEGYYWLERLRTNHFGGCLADDMGLGKTLQTITLLESVYAQAPQKEGKRLEAESQLSLFQELESTIPSSLVVAPTSLLHNWRNELRKFAPTLKIYMHAGNNRLKTKEIGKIFDHYQVVITSYGTMRSDIEFLQNYAFYYVILDESQYIKNPDSLLYHAAQLLTSSHRLVLTGTPIENSLTDLWAQYNFINPGLLGNYAAFKSNYIQKITKEQNKQAELSLQKLIQPFLLRRTKEDVAPELPPMTQEVVYCNMTESQEEVYNTEKNSIRNLLLEQKEKLPATNFMALQSLMRLRLLANHPQLTHAKYEGSSGKFDQIMLFFESVKAGGHKVLIFSSFVKHLRLLSNKFDENGWKYAMLIGQTTNREAEISKFKNDKDIHCFFISLKAGGTGLNLTAADYVFIIDPWWNPAAEMQALSRSHRIGQEKNVMVYRFISSDTIEEKIIQLQEIKSRLSETFITSNGSLKQLTFSEITSLLE